MANSMRARGGQVAGVEIVEVGWAFLVLQQHHCALAQKVPINRLGLEPVSWNILIEVRTDNDISRPRQKIEMERGESMLAISGRLRGLRKRLRHEDRNEPASATGS
jgi:hypothetical protein